MKKIFFVLLLPVLIFACGSEESDKKAQEQRDSLQAIINARDEKLEEFFGAFNEIQDNLKTIKEKENIITSTVATDAELEQSSKDQINEDIVLIYELLLKNRQTLSTMKQQLAAKNAKNSEMEKTLATLIAHMEEKNQEIAQLKEVLAGKNIDIENLNAEIAGLSAELDSLVVMNKSKQTVIEEKISELNTAYYVYGTSKELREQQVITKKGGFIGIGRMEKLLENFNKEYFSKIDITKTTSIEIFSKKAKIVTTHPANSYKFTGDKTVETLEITNPEEFWSVSKYLVIVVD